MQKQPECLRISMAQTLLSPVMFWKRTIPPSPKPQMMSSRPDDIIGRHSRLPPAGFDEGAMMQSVEQGRRR